jgi:hypothetical protein
MDRVQLLLLGLPILLFCSDVVTLFAPQPPATPKPDRHQHQPATGAVQPGDSSPNADADADSAQVAVSSTFSSVPC